MSESISAALYLRQETLSFAEIEHLETSHRLRRVNRRTFDFDLLEALRGGSEHREALRQLKEGLREELEGTAASTVKVAVHPHEGYSFFTPLATDLSVEERKQELIRQAALVTGVRSARSLHLSSQTVRTVSDAEEESFMWVHVLALPAEVEERIDALIQEGSVRSHSWMVSSEAAARLMGRIERSRPSHEEALQPYSLAIGEYPSHTEYALSRDREWHHAHYTQAADSPEDRAYYAVGFLNRIDVPATAIGRLFLYGPEVDLDAYASLASIFGPQPEHLDPLRAIHDGTETGPEEGLNSYVLCIGAGLTPFV